MSSWLLAPVFVGLLIVSQGVLNRGLGQAYGLSIAVFINASVFFILAGILLSICVKFSMFGDWIPAFIQPHWERYYFHWWHVVPGICGFFLVLLIPWSIANLGSSTVFILLVSSQIVASVFLDIFKNQVAPTSTKIIAIVLVLLGAFFYTK